MSDVMKIGHLRLTADTQIHKGAQKEQATGRTESFQEVLDRNVLKFSHHAETRMAQRGITFKPETLSKIVNAIDQAAAKGAKDSLIVYKGIAMIVNVPTRTVVTALDGNKLQSNVFTQIDSAVIVN